MRPLLRKALVALLLFLPLWAQAQPAQLAAGLDATQRDWLQAHPQLRVGVVLEAPYAQQDRRLQQLSGANVELLEWIAGSLGVNLQWQVYSDQNLLERAARAGEIDMAPDRKSVV